MVTGLPECRTRMRIGELGSHSPIATKLRSLSKITARSPTAPRWLIEVIDSLKTHGWPARIWRRASAGTRTAIRLSPTTGSWSNTDMSSGYAMWNSYAPGMTDQLERTTNLLALLLESRTPLTFDDIVNQLGDQYPPGHAAMRGAFERDKGLL